MLHMDTWAKGVARNVGEAIREARNRQGITASELAERVTAAGLEMTRAVVTAMETGRRSTVSVPELLVLAWVLKVPPVALMYPHMPDKEVEAVPGEVMTELDAALWVAGERPHGGVEFWMYEGANENAPLYALPAERWAAKGEDTRMRWDYLDYFRKWQALGQVDSEEQPEEFLSAFAQVLMKYSELNADGRPVQNPLDYLPSTESEPEGIGHNLMTSIRNLNPELRNQFAHALHGEVSPSLRSAAGTDTGGKSPELPERDHETGPA